MFRTTCVKTKTTVNKYQVCLAGNRYKKHLLVRFLTMSLGFTFEGVVAEIQLFLASEIPFR